ncbi:Fic/DOC family protein [Curtobacterium sp. YR515]|uniref:Fic/DOC family protein n=1 Tax=Curtobacterium sp. YR515 TaxID=1855316 RepID=UPI0020C86C18|nr:Fic family protein [Curtobacterium sp. YR515]
MTDYININVSDDDKYTYPGSGGVLINSKGIRDQARLDQATNDYASAAMAELSNEPIPDRPDAGYLRSIHERMFERIAPNIAGRTRDVDVQATGTGIPYCRPEYIDENMAGLFRKLDREDYLTGLDPRAFADRLADRWGELSAIHPYRDGNTRTQSFYVSTLAERAGHPIDWQRVNVDELRAHRLNAVAGQECGLADYLHERLMTPGEQGRQVPTLTADQQRIVEMLARQNGRPATEATRPLPPGVERATSARSTGLGTSRGNTTDLGR